MNNHCAQTQDAWARPSCTSLTKQSINGFDALGLLAGIIVICMFIKNATFIEG